jgi:hypothetical protein
MLALTNHHILTTVSIGPLSATRSQNCSQESQCISVQGQAAESESVLKISADNYIRHTPGLCCMQVDLKDEGSFLFTGDQFHLKENYTKRTPQGLFHGFRFLPNN